MSGAELLTHTPPKPLPALTGVRGVAALWVVLSHYALVGWISGDFFRRGFFGVDIFFILSGFILAHVHLGDFQRFSATRIRRFFALRFFRVYPLHVTVLLIMLLVITLFPIMAAHVERNMNDPDVYSVKSFFYCALLIQNWSLPREFHWNGVSWTLGVEMVAYLFFPLLAFLMQFLRSSGGCLILAAALLLTLGGLMQYHGYIDRNMAYHWGFYRIAFEFPAGILLRRAFDFGDPKRRGWAIIALGAIAVALLVEPLRFLIYPAFGGLIAGLACERDWIKRVFIWRPVAFLGEISFSLYLIHFLVIDAIGDMIELHPRIQPYQAEILWVSPLAWLLAATLLNRGVEKPARHFGRIVFAKL